VGFSKGSDGESVAYTALEYNLIHFSFLMIYAARRMSILIQDRALYPRTISTQNSGIFRDQHMKTGLYEMRSVYQLTDQAYAATKR
jgi:hypothetical protein